jgi:hypothetical protein
MKMGRGLRPLICLAWARPMDDIVLQFRTQPLLGYRLATATAAALAIFMDLCSECAALTNIGAATGMYNTVVCKSEGALSDTGEAHPTQRRRQPQYKCSVGDR